MEQSITIKTEQTCSNNEPQLFQKLFYSIRLFYSRIYNLKECGK